MALNITKRRQGGNVQETKVIAFPDQTLIRGKDNGDVLPVKVDSQGRLVIAANIDVGDVTIGAVEQGKRSQDAEPWDVQIAGSSIDLRGLAANRPAANSVPLGTTYWSIDTGDISVSTGSVWRNIGEA